MINVTIWASVYGAFEKDPEKVSLNNGKLLNGLDTQLAIVANSLQSELSHSLRADLQP